MMHRCSSSQGNMVGPCSCGLFHSQSNSFSMLFSMPNHKSSYDQTDMMYPYTSSSSSSSVDCTLSLGTPSTRLCEEYDVVEDKRSSSRYDHRRSGSNSCMSNICWDMLQNNKKSSRGNNGNNCNSNSNNSSSNDSLLARRCANCDTTSTPLWRNGPRGPKSLCNACGIRFKKEERRATAANANNNSSGAMLDHHQQQQQQYQYGAYGQYHSNNSWVHHQTSQNHQKMPCLSPVNEFRFIEDSDRDSDTNGIPFLSWRLNVTDRPTNLVHDFTR